MASQNEVRGSHEQFSAAWSLDARAGGVGEDVDVKGIRVTNARSPWYLMNAALLTGPVSSPAELAARANAASAYFGREHRFAAVGEGLRPPKHGPANHGLTRTRLIDASSAVTRL
jgi:hypothetical protein